jgi:hypothetical protein
VSTGRFGDVFAALHGGDACAVEGPAASRATPETPFDAADSWRSLRGRHGDDTRRERGQEVMVPSWAGNVRGAVDSRR